MTRQLLSISAAPALFILEAKVATMLTEAVRVLTNRSGQVLQQLWRACLMLRKAGRHRQSGRVGRYGTRRNRSLIKYLREMVCISNMFKETF